MPVPTPVLPFVTKPRNDIWPSSLGGAKTSYRRVWEQMWEMAGDKKGMTNVKLSDGREGVVPTLNNHDAIVLVRTWRHAAARSKSSKLDLWWEFLRSAFGQYDLTVKYDVSTGHAQKPYPSIMLAQLWADTRELADKLDAEGTVQRAIPIDQSIKAREAAAREAWREQLHRAQVKIPIPGNPDVTPPKTPTPPLPVVPSAGGWGWLALLLAGLYITKRSR